MNLNVIIGENGSGKSTLISFIANVFRNLERFPERISSNFIFTYNLHKISGDITLNFSYPQLEIINQDNIFKFNFKKSKDTILLKLFKKPEVAYKEYKFLLPEIISVSNFSLDSFFPKNFPSNYIGDRNVYFNTIDTPTVINKYSLNLSRGTILFFNKYKSNSFKTKLKEILNLEFYDYVSFVSKTSHLEDSVIEHIYYKNFKDINPFFTLKSFKTALKKNIFFKDFTSLPDIFSSCYNLNLKRLVSHNHSFYFNLLLTFAEMECIYINDIFIEKENTIISFLDMSSGEKSFIYRVLGSLSNAYDDSIIIFDGLETHLNTVWSRQILWFLKELFSDFYLYMFISTHSYLFINSVFNENLIFLKNFKQKKLVNLFF